MKKITVFILVIGVCFLFSACASDADKIAENNTDIAEETTSDSLINDVQDEKHSYSSSGGSIKLEDITAEYVEPDFKIVSTLAECYDYFDTVATDTITTEKYDDGKVSLITVTGNDGNIKATMKFIYDDNILVTANYYKNDEVTEKIAFSFYDEDSLSIASHVVGEANMSLYFYNEDGTFNSYVDSAGFSSMLVGSIMEGIGSAFSQ